MTSPARGLLAFLRQVPDPRGRKGRRHPLEAMLATIVCSVLCGARGCAAIAEWVRIQEPDFWHQLGYRRRPPCQNAYRNLLSDLDVEAFENALTEWTGEVWADSDVPPLVSDVLPVESIDGKVLRGTLTEHSRAVCLVTRVDQATGRVLSQTQVDSKTNEHKAALAMLKELVLESKLTGRLIVGDAAFCQRDICQTIDDSGGYYLIDVKENQPSLVRECRLAFGEKRAFSPLPQEVVGR